jgi:cytochrome b
VKVWDPLVRAAHWLLVAAVAAAWLTRAGWGKWHEWIGYMTLGLIMLRVAWGWLGPRYARFSQFVRGPSATLKYAKRAAVRSEPRHVGHNPLGGWMIVALIVVTTLAGLSGWLYVTDAYWGDERVERLHDVLATLLLVLVALHIAGVLLASFRHRENLVGSMIHGRKRPPGSGDVA